MATGEAFRVGPVEVYGAGRMVRRDGVTVPIGARAFDLLEALLKERHRVVPKAELLDMVWPGMVVEEHNLATQISTLRKVLGVHAIVTVPGRGYRLTAPVQALNERAPLDALPTGEPGRHSRAGPQIPAGDAALPAYPAAPSGPATPDPPLTHPRSRGSSASAGPPVQCFGREAAVQELLSLTRTHRLTTLLGPGGVGKTTLARAVASQMAAVPSQQDKPPDTNPPPRLHWLSLEALHSAQELNHALCAWWKITDVVCDDTPEALAARFAGQAPVPGGLLVLDNAEHLLGDVRRWAAALLNHSPDLRLLVTSQARLRLPQEATYRVPPLGIPAAQATPDEAARSPAWQCFRQLAEQQMGQLSWDDAACSAATDICRLLEGNPLALRLAAGRLPMTGLPGLAGCLQRQITLLSAPAEGGGSPRHDSLAAALEWSLGLLVPAHRQALQRLAQLSGTASLPVAAWLCHPQLPAQDSPVMPPAAAVDVLADLVDRAFVEVLPAEPPRYRVPGPLRLYLQSQEPSLRQPTEEKHVLASLLHRQKAAEAAYWDSADGQWLAEHGPDIDALRAALAVGLARWPGLALRLIAFSSFLFLQLGAANEARRHWHSLQARLADAPGEDEDAVRYLIVGSRLHWGIDTELQQALADRAWRMAQVHGHRVLQYLALRCSLGSGRRSLTEGEGLLSEMAALEDPAWPARLKAQRLLAAMDHYSGAGDDTTTSLRPLRRAREQLLDLATEEGLDALAAWARVGMAEGAWLEGAPQAAVERCANLLNAPYLLYGNLRLRVLATMAGAQLTLHHTLEARATLREYCALCRQRGWEWFDSHLELLAWLAAQEGAVSLARTLAGRADGAMQDNGPHRPLHGGGSATLRVRSHLKLELEKLPPSAPPADPPHHPLEVCRALGLLESEAGALPHKL